MIWVCGRMLYCVRRMPKSDSRTDLNTARKILGQDAIIGITVNSWKEAEAATLDGADYLGIGTVFSTKTSDLKTLRVCVPRLTSQ